MRSHYINFLVPSAPSQEPTNFAFFASTKVVLQAFREARKAFITGYRNNVKFKQELKTNPELQAKVRATSAGDFFPQLDDKYFATWDANRIEGTNFVAAAGPQFLQQMPLFLENTVYNRHMPIRYVVALGDKLALNDASVKHTIGFYDYCVHSRRETFGNYKATIQKISGKHLLISSPEHKFSCPANVVQSRIQIKNTNDSKQEAKSLDVTVIKLADNEALCLDTADDELKEALWRIFQISLSEPILIHCTAGVGRTGHVIFTLELLKHFYRIFAAHNNPQIIAADIHAILYRIRRNRPGLVAVRKQFERAICNALALQDYAIKKEQALQQLATSLTVDPEGKVSVVFTPTLFTINSSACHFYQRPAEAMPAIDETYKAVQQRELANHAKIKSDEIMKVHGIRVCRNDILHTLAKKGEKTAICEVGATDFTFYREVVKHYKDRIQCSGVIAKRVSDDTPKTYVAANAEYLSELFGENRFDAIFSDVAYMKFSDPIGSLVEAYKALKVDGFLIIAILEVPGLENLENFMRYLEMQGYKVIGEIQGSVVIDFMIQKTIDKPELHFPVLFDQLKNNFVHYQPSPALKHTLKSHQDDTYFYRAGVQELCTISRKISEKYENLLTLFASPQYHALDNLYQYYLILCLTYKNNLDPTPLIERFNKLKYPMPDSKPDALFRLCTDPNFATRYAVDQQRTLIEFTAYKNLVSLGYTHHTVNMLNSMGIFSVREGVVMPKAKLNFTLNSNNALCFR